MLLNEINIRDPYMLLHEDVYYLYGTRSATTWGEADGFDAYSSEDLIHWDGPVEIFHKGENFWADRCYWAPECYFYKGSFYLVTTFASETKNMGVQILKSDSPLGPFEIYSDGPITPKEWKCLDGTIYFNKKGKPFMIFGHSFQDDPKGEMYAVELREDLKTTVGEPKLLFYASDAKWAKPIPFAKQEFGIEGDVFFVDGPCLYHTSEGELRMFWSSWGEHGYAVGVAYSDNGDIDGKWNHKDRPFFSENGGHGMIFKNKKMELFYLLHNPNDLYMERPHLIKMDNAMLNII
ncbi:MAG: glycoside hydrolase family 43 protein [Lachnospiraceae bacterium]